MFSYHQVKEHPKLLLAMTSLSCAEFHQLLPHFQYALDQYVTQHYVDRDNRQRQYGAGRSESTLVSLEDKLLFILYYVKVYPLQEMLAFAFGMVQSTANEWIQLLSEVLKRALDHGGYVPERDPKQLETVLDVHFVSPSPVLSPGIAGLQPGSRSHAGAWRLPGKALENWQWIYETDS